ncbi:Hypothetical protein NAEGRDRAFT_80151 [Naegleria gruberi]|uniref:Uncharacterized protein n=1 Tax=Naegleria gruberi TaxID=5762 RepID=D2VJ32_NAEGR|nr:uncharacterized protein NAEGRDRAFT_80151 [Naegleria gruberi]EFC43206.1 Hypothetical protein NAEGRDRAFT_80151 [Naegleria gruberi]|eukprot:XP_002675950.1 Hypothetical protein NAEGRDRAFT_80151 [Naegleria gruberi strain NEG-M]
MDTERVFKDNAWFLLIKYFTLKPEPKLLNITTKINFLKKNLAAVTVEKIENLNNNDHQILKLYLGEDCVKSLADMIQQINTYKEHINDMRKILDAYCTHCSDFEKMKKKYKDLYDGMMKMSFSEFQNQSVSGAENKNLKTIICCKQSKSFSKLLKARTSKHTSLVSDIIDLGSAISVELTHFSYELFLGENTTFLQSY